MTDNISNDASLLRDAAERLAKKRGFLANVLASALPGDEPVARLAETLDCSLDDATRLLLMRAPRPEGAFFKADVVRIAAAANVGVGQLMALIREANSLAAFEDDQAGPSMLMAAQDHVPDGDGG